MPDNARKTERNYGDMVKSGNEYLLSIPAGEDERVACWSRSGKDGRSNGCVSACALLVRDRVFV